MQQLPLDVHRIRAGLVTSEIGSRLLYFPVVESTNQVLQDLAPDQRPHGTLVLTDFQTEGRGRRGRRWTAPRGSSVLMSVVLDAPKRCATVQTLMAASVALWEAIQRVTALPVTLKWPNDVTIRGRKVSGVLAETSRDGQTVLLGMGINVNFDPASEATIPSTASSLSRELGRDVDREELIVLLVNALNLWYGCLARDSEEVYAAWASRLDTLGRSVTVEEPGRSWRGRALRVLSDGGLVVQAGDSAERVVYAADVSIRGIDSFTVS